MLVTSSRLNRDVYYASSSTFYDPWTKTLFSHVKITVVSHRIWDWVTILLFAFLGNKLWISSPADFPIRIVLWLPQDSDSTDHWSQFIMDTYIDNAIRFHGSHTFRRKIRLWMMRIFYNRWLYRVLSIQATIIIFFKEIYALSKR